MIETGGFTLNTQSVLTQFNTAPSVTPYGATEMKIPSPSVTLPKTLSYKFRVAEHVDTEGNIKKVGLQVAVFEHDNYGVAQLKQNWTDIERVKVDYVAPVG